MALAVGEHVADLPVDTNLLAAERNEALAPGGSADFQIERRGAGNIGFLGQYEAGTGLIEHDGLELVGKQGFEFVEVLLGFEKLALAGARAHG